MKKLLVGLLALGSISSFASETKCESILGVQEAFSERTIYSGTIINADNVTLGECAQLASQAYKANAEIQGTRKHKVIFTNSEALETKIIIKH